VLFGHLSLLTTFSLIHPITITMPQSGAVLSYCEEVADLMGPDVGVVGKPTARALLAKILEWNASGVPF
jgi:hypothetical protein